MYRRNLRQLVLLCLASLVGVGLLLGLASLLNTKPGFAGTLGSSPLGWAAPVASMLVIFGVIWLLLSQTTTGGQDHGDLPRGEPCPSCGRQVLPDWRLCPYCGSILEEPTGDVSPAHR